VEESEREKVESLTKRVISNKKLAFFNPDRFGFSSAF